MKKRILGCLILLTATRSRAEIPLESNVVRDLFSHRNQAPSALVLKRQIIDLAVERGLLDPARLPLYAAPGLKTFLPDFEERLDVDVFMALLQKPEMQPERERIELFVEDLISLYTTHVTTTLTPDRDKVRQAVATGDTGTIRAAWGAYVGRHLQPTSVFAGLAYDVLATDVPEMTRRQHGLVLPTL